MIIYTKNPRNSQFFQYLEPIQKDFEFFDEILQYLEPIRKDFEFFDEIFLYRFKILKNNHGKSEHIEECLTSERHK